MNVWQTVLDFYDKWIWTGCSKFPALWWEYLASAISVLKNSPKIPDLTKRDVLQLCVCENNE